MKEVKYFKKYMLRYLLVCSLIIFGCIPFATLSYKHIRENKISENIAKLEAGVKDFENNIQKMKMIGSLLAHDSMLLDLEQVKGEVALDKQLCLKYLMEKMFDISIIYDYSPYFFIMFRENEAFISKSQVSRDYQQYYGDFFYVNQYEKNDFKSLVFDQDNLGQFIRLEEVGYFSENRMKVSKDVLLYVEPLQVDYSFSANKAILGYVVEANQVANTFLTTEGQQKGIIRMTDRKGHLLLSYGSDAELLQNVKEKEMIKSNKETYKIIKYSDVDNGIDVVVGYPMSLIDEQMHDVFVLLIIYGALGIGIALIIILFFSKNWYKPISRLMKEVQRVEGIQLNKLNEFDYVRQSILRLVSAKDEFETKMLLSNAQKQAIFLENVFIKGFYKKENEVAFLKQFPLAAKEYRVIYLNIISTDDISHENMVLFEAIDFLENNLDTSFIHVHSMKDTQILLIPYDQSVKEEMIQAFFYKLIEMVIKKHSALCFVGISQIQHVISNINVAYNQARLTVHAYQYMHSDFVKFYQYASEDDTGLINLNYLNKLFDLLISGSRNDIHKILDDLRSEVIGHKERYEMHKAEIFHMIIFVEYSALKQLRISKKETLKTRQFQQNHSIEECLEIVKNIADEICDQIDSNTSERKKKLYKRIMSYLYANFKRYEITTELAANEIGISDRYLAAFLKEQTGKTFAVNLDERRIEFAKECLINTDRVNERIAQESGFGATNSFYRVFKKYVGMTPNEYKKSRLKNLD